MKRIGAWTRARAVFLSSRCCSCLRSRCRMPSLLTAARRQVRGLRRRSRCCARRLRDDDDRRVDAAAELPPCPVCGARRRRPACTRSGPSTDPMRELAAPCSVTAALDARNGGLLTAIHVSSTAGTSPPRRPTGPAGARSSARPSSSSQAAGGARSSLVPDGLLDVGAGAGAFSSLRVATGWEADGIELSRELAHAQQRAAAHAWSHEISRANLPAPSSAPVPTTVRCGRSRFLHTTIRGLCWIAQGRCSHRPACSSCHKSTRSSLSTRWPTSLAPDAHRPRETLELLYDKRHTLLHARTLVTLLERPRLRIEHAETHRAHLGRWLSEPASRAVLLGAEIVDLLSCARSPLSATALYVRREPPVARSCAMTDAAAARADSCWWGVRGSVAALSHGRGRWRSPVRSEREKRKREMVDR